MRFVGPCRISIDEVARPTVVEPGDAVVRVTTASIGPGDLERYAGQDSDRQVTPGGACAGVIEATGRDVQRWRPGDVVIVPAAIRIGPGSPPTEPPPVLVLGRDVPGSHSGWLRVAAADENVASLPDPANFEAQAVLAADAYAIGARAARHVAVSRPDAVCVVGCDAASLAFISAWKALKEKGRLIAADSAPGRVMVARRAGATGVVLPASNGQADVVRERSSRVSFDAVVVGSKVEGSSLDLASELAAPGMSPIVLLDPPGTGWSANRGRTETARPTATATEPTTVMAGFPTVLEIEAHVADLRSGTLDLLPFISHTFPLSEAAVAYDLALKKERGVLKVLLKA